jgi:preprotein translocase subunit YajC
MIISRKKGDTMTTEKMEAYSLEIGDQITIQGGIYRIVEIEDGDNLDYRFVLVDEEGYRRHIEAEFSKKFSLVLDNLTEV